MSQQNISQVSIYKNLFDDKDKVFELVKNDFNISPSKISLNPKKFKNHPKSLILFYAPWCTHCKEFKKKYIDLAMDYFLTYSFGAVNIENTKDKNDELRYLAKIEYIPTLKYVDDKGDLQDFPYTVDYDNIIYFLNT